ncbi:hypothetical protein [Streptomyces sp. bgisy084]
MPTPPRHPFGYAVDAAPPRQPTKTAQPTNPTKTARTDPLHRPTR